MKRTLLVVGGGIEAVPGIQLAQELGLRVVVSDGNPLAPGLAIADEALVADTYDVKATLDAAGRYRRSKGPIHGVMCIASDVPLTVAAVAEALELPGIPVAAACLAMDKLAMKRQFLKDGVAIPWFAPVGSIDDLEAIAEARGFPLVIKPVDSRGARGVLRLQSDVDLTWAFKTAKAHSPSGRVMVEEFLAGPQVSTESMILDNEVYTVGFSDRNYEFLDRYAPHMIENGGELPSRLSPAIQGAIHQLVRQAARSMGMRNGVVKGDIVVVDGKPHVIELAARLSGGYFCTHEIPFSTGVRFVEHAIRLALGDKVCPDDLRPRTHAHVAQRYLFPKPGRVINIANVDKASHKLGIRFCEVRAKVGDVIPNCESHPARAGVVIAVGSSREDAVAKATEAIETIEIATDCMVSA